MTNRATKILAIAALAAAGFPYLAPDAAAEAARREIHGLEKRVVQLEQMLKKDSKGNVTLSSARSLILHAEDKLDLRSESDMQLESQRGLDLRSAMKMRLESQIDLDLVSRRNTTLDTGLGGKWKTAGMLELKGGAIVKVDGGQIMLGNGGVPAARMGDMAHGPFGPGTVVATSSKVLIGN